MHDPKFNIGDDIIIVYSDTGEVYSNGDHKVLEIVFYDEAITRDNLKFKNVFCYRISNDPTGDGYPWHERALRPKPKGNGKSMTEFMNEIKNTKHKELATA